MLHSYICYFRFCQSYQLLYKKNIKDNRILGESVFCIKVVKVRGFAKNHSTLSKTQNNKYKIAVSLSFIVPEGKNDNSNFYSAPARNCPAIAALQQSPFITLLAYSRELVRLINNISSKK